MLSLAEVVAKAAESYDAIADRAMVEAHDLLLSKGSTDAELDANMSRYWQQLQDHRAKVLADFEAWLLRGGATLQ